ncbi:hypothetical protein NCS52_01499100 [Fusarium sp. LHS14.1]|nr:hypothetical protein NCS52_01499100 [Fusarium sp. LHS14.1]
MESNSDLQPRGPSPRQTALQRYGAFQARASHRDACLSPESIMTDGAISGSPPGTGTTGYGGFRDDLAPRLVP